jgi:hypothetical protein
MTDKENTTARQPSKRDTAFRDRYARRAGTLLHDNPERERYRDALNKALREWNALHLDLRLRIEREGVPKDMPAHETIYYPRAFLM